MDRVIRRNWSDRPFGPATPAGEVAGQGEVISSTGGESTVIHEIDGYQGWVAKLYRAPLPTSRASELERLIALPGEMRDPRDLALVDSSTTWPVSRITESGQTTGVIFAKAPDDFLADVSITAERTRRIALTVDHLAIPEERQQRLGINVPSQRDRLRAARAIVAVGNLFEQHGLVYGDWSYSNTFWSSLTGQVLVIDIDSCGFTRRSWIASNTWDDPQVPPGRDLTAYTDRYKLALMTVRCVTGVRGDGLAALDALPPWLRGSRLEQVIEDNLTSRPTARPSLPALLEALDEVLGQPAAAAVRTADPPTQRLTATVPAAYPQYPAAGGRAGTSRPPRSAGVTPRADTPAKRRAAASPAAVAAGWMLTVVLAAVIALIIYLVL